MDFEDNEDEASELEGEHEADDEVDVLLDLLRHLAQFMEEVIEDVDVNEVSEVGFSFKEIEIADEGGLDELY